MNGKKIALAVVGLAVGLATIYTYAYFAGKGWKKSQS